MAPPRGEGPCCPHFHPLGTNYPHLGNRQGKWAHCLHLRLLGNLQGKWAHCLHLRLLGNLQGRRDPLSTPLVYWGTSRGSGSTVDTSATGEPPEGKWVTLSTPPSSGRQGDRLGAVLAEAVGTRYKMSQAAHLDVPGLKSQEFGNQPLEYNL